MSEQGSRTGDPLQYRHRNKIDEAIGARVFLLLEFEFSIDAAFHRLHQAIPYNTVNNFLEKKWNDLNERLLDLVAGALKSISDNRSLVNCAAGDVYPTFSDQQIAALHEFQYTVAALTCHFCSALYQGVLEGAGRSGDIDSQGLCLEVASIVLEERLNPLARRFFKSARTEKRAT